MGYRAKTNIALFALVLALASSAFLAYASAAPSNNGTAAVESSGGTTTVPSSGSTSAVGSSGGVAVTPPAGGTVAPAATSALPRTGASSWPLVIFGLALVACGTGFVLLRRRSESHV
ncbi:MAG TPA: LPXTG cell wall anchor domain-containing protein [Acidimicrobiia bacterium]|nr:LPXTG cell wall anchor domain-containing protein [Acidimicrobiia bacterium]